MIFIHTTVGQNNDIDTLAENTVYFNKETIDCLFQTRIFVISNRHNLYLKALSFHVFNFQNIGIGQNRIFHF